MAERLDNRVLKGFERLFADRRIWLCLFAATALGSLLRYLNAFINHDTAWYLDATRRWLEGAVLYRDIIEVNPPLAFFLTTPPVAIAEATGLFPVTVYVLYIYLLIALSLLLAWRLLRALPAGSVLMQRGVILAGLLALTLCTAGDFGQREHLMLILTFPYLVLIALRALRLDCTAALAIATGCFAVLGFGLKPHFLLVPAVLEVYLLLRRRNLRGAFRPETLVLGAGIAAYLGIIVTATPNYLTTIIPFASEVYAGYEAALWRVLLQVRFGILCLLLFAWFYLRQRREIAEQEVVDVFLIAALGFLLIYYAQSKAWHYHLYPAVGMLLLAAVVLLIVTLQAREHPAEAASHPSRRGASLFVALLPLLLLFDAQIVRGTYSNGFMQKTAPFVRAHAAGSSIYLFTAHVRATYPLVTYTGTRSPSRFPALWLMPGLMRKEAEAGGRSVDSAANELHGSIAHYMRESVLADLQSDPPALIVVDVRQTKTYFGDIDFDYIAYFSEDPRFAAFWSDYEPLTTVIGHRIFLRRVADQTADAGGQARTVAGPQQDPETVE